MRRICVILFMLVGTAFAQELPTAVGYLNDFAGVLTIPQRQALDAKFRTLQDLPDNPQVVAVLPATLGGVPVETYAHALATQWKIGQAGKNNGILVVLAPNERKIRVEVGYGLEGTIPDSRAKAIVEAMAQQTRGGKNDWNAALEVAATEIGKLLTPAAKAEPADSVKEPTNWPIVFAWLILCVLILTSVVFALLIHARKAQQRREEEEIRNSAAHKRRQQREIETETDMAFTTGMLAGVPVAAAVPVTAAASSRQPIHRPPPETKHKSESRRRSDDDDSYHSSSSSSSSSSWSSSDSGSSFSGGGGSFGGGGASGDA